MPGVLAPAQFRVSESGPLADVRGSDYSQVLLGYQSGPVAHAPGSVGTGKLFQNQQRVPSLTLGALFASVLCDMTDGIEPRP